MYSAVPLNLNGFRLQTRFVSFVHRIKLSGYYCAALRSLYGHYIRDYALCTIYTDVMSQGGKNASSTFPCVYFLKSCHGLMQAMLVQIMIRLFHGLTLFEIGTIIFDEMHVVCGCVFSLIKYNISGQLQTVQLSKVWKR